MMVNEKVEIDNSLITFNFARTRLSHGPVTLIGYICLFSLLCLSEITGIAELDGKLTCPFDEQQVSVNFVCGSDAGGQI